MINGYQLKVYPDAVLRGQAAAVNTVDGSVNELIQAMTNIMYRYNGIGLAAPQVGYLQRIIMADIGEGLITLINPQIREAEGQAYAAEGCLSLPDIRVTVDRHDSILVQGIDVQGREVQYELNGLSARVIQHEIDHLNGVLIIDYASTVEKYRIRDTLQALKLKQKTV